MGSLSGCWLQGAGLCQAAKSEAVPAPPTEVVCCLRWLTFHSMASSFLSIALLQSGDHGVCAADLGNALRCQLIKHPLVFPRRFLQPSYRCTRPLCLDGIQHRSHAEPSAIFSMSSEHRSPQNSAATSFAAVFLPCWHLSAGSLSLTRSRHFTTFH